MTSIINKQSIMSNQFESNSDHVIPDIAIKIKELSATKQVLLKMIIDMYPMSNDPLTNVYARPMIRLLQSIINIYKFDVLLELEDGLVSVLVTYIYDIADLIKGQLNIEKYEPRHKNLVAIHKQVDYHMHYNMQNNDRQSLEELKSTLFLI